jgi:hypothetical protein
VNPHGDLSKVDADDQEGGSVESAMFSSSSIESVRTVFLRTAFTITVIFSTFSASVDNVPVVRAQEASSPIRVWAAVAAIAPVFSTGEPVNVVFAATNVGKEPIARALVREQTVLVINGQQWQESARTFSSGPGSIEKMLAPGKSQVFGAQLTNLFRKPGVYRLVWKGKGFESLPIEFRVADDPY